MRWQRNLLHQGVLKLWGEKPQSSLKHVPQKPVQNTCSTQKALSISREHLRLYRLQRLTRMWHVNYTTQNPAADIESLLFSAYIWKAFVRCLPSAGLISKRQRKSEACLFFPAQPMGRAAHCLWSHQAFKNGQEAGKKVRFFFPWGPAERVDHPLPPSSKLKCQLLIKPLSIATYNQLPMLLKTP